MPKQRLSNDDYCRAADKLQCEVASIKAVASVESRGNGFDMQDRPKILFERHKFAKYTNGKYINTLILTFVTGKPEVTVPRHPNTTAFQRHLCSIHRRR